MSFESAWSPDGQLIAFDSDRKDIAGRKAVQIYVMTADGGDVTQLTRGPGFHPDISPDGQWITFDSGDTGTPGSEGWGTHR